MPYNPQYTPNRHLPYPTLPDSADVPRDVKALALALDAPAGGQGGAGTPVLTAAQVLEVGQGNQIRAGRQLTAVDFTRMGLSAPLGLWNLSDLTDVSGNARALTNKGAVPFGVGINGLATTSAQFAGSTAQALYIADTGAADPFRIKTGSVGGWFRTAKRSLDQGIITKWGASNAVSGWRLQVSGNVVGMSATDGTSFFGVGATSDVGDDRWHHAVATHDGTVLRVYVDGALEARLTVAVPLNSGATAPLNVGGQTADSGTVTGNPNYGRVDEAFVTADVLTDDQIRNLYSARIPHGLIDAGSAPIAPTTITLNIRRRRRGAALAVSDFPSQPVRLHNFTGGALTDQGSNGVALAPVGGGSIVAVAGADGSLNGGQSFSGAHTGLGATDAGLPAALTSRSYGCWFKTTQNTTVPGVLGWGAGASSASGAQIGVTSGNLYSQSGADILTVGGFVADGLWHHVTVTEDNAAGDGVRRKVYLDGRFVGGSTVMNTLTLGGANRFRLGAYPDGTTPFTGQIDGAFIHAAALTGEQVRALYAVGSQALAPSPKDPGDHVEAMEAAGLLAVFDSVESSDLLDVVVSA